MRNTELEQKFLNRAFMFAGAGLVFGLFALAIGTEMLVLSYWSTDPVKFWIWQGVWAICVSFVISTLARLAKNG
jgi:hypothetical protein